jgi:hypothetical protein
VELEFRDPAGEAACLASFDGLALDVCCCKAFPEADGEENCRLDLISC